jgi:hypothetical protein
VASIARQGLVNHQDTDTQRSVNNDYDAVFSMQPALFPLWSIPRLYSIMRTNGTNDLLCKACIDRGLMYSAKGRIFNNMLYVRYVHLTSGRAHS